MATQWRDRLREKVEAAGKSQRAISMEIGASPSYLHSILVKGAEPTIDKMMRLADVLGVSLSWLMYGVELGAQEEELLRLFAGLPEKQRQAILDLAAGLSPKN